MSRQPLLSRIFYLLIGIFFPDIIDNKLFTRYSAKFKLKKRPTDQSITFPPLVDTDQIKRFSKYYLQVDEKRKLYKFYSELNGAEFSNTPKGYWVYYMEFDRELPYFILDSMFNRVKIERSFKDFEKITLEGDFSHGFNLYAPTKDHINVLAVLGPDLMDAVVDFWESIDVIVAGKKAWIITRQHSDDKIVEDILDAGDKVFSELAHSARTHKYAPPANS